MFTNPPVASLTDLLRIAAGGLPPYCGIGGKLSPSSPERGLLPSRLALIVTRRFGLVRICKHAPMYGAVAISLLLIVLDGAGLGTAWGQPALSSEGAEPKMASLNLEPLQNLTLRLERAAPGTRSSGSFSLSIGNEGAVTVDKLTLSSDPVIDKERRRLVAARLEASLDGERGQAASIPARSTRGIVLRLQGFEETGTFLTALVLQSPDLPKVLRIPLTIEVSDGSLLPILVISLGVMLAFLVSQVAQRWRPREENRYRAAQLAAEIERWRRTALAAGREELRKLSDSLTQAEERTSFGALDAAKTLLDDIEKGLEAYRKRQYELRAAALVNLDALTAQMEMLDRRRVDLPGDMQEKINVLHTGMSEVRTLLNQESVEAAEAQRQTMQKLADELARSLQQSSADIKSRSQEPDGAEVVPALAFSISVAEPADARLAQSELSFRLTGSLPKVDEVIWDFDDGEPTASTTGSSQANHRFARAGDYLIKASLRRGGSEVHKAFLRLMVLPPRSERVLSQIRGTLAAADWALFAIALVLATLSGWMSLCDGKVFGSGANYITAFFWGFGIDSSLRGVTNIFKKITAN